MSSHLPTDRRLWYALLAAAPPTVAVILQTLAQLDRTTTEVVGAFLSNPVGFVRAEAGQLLLDVVTAFVGLFVDFLLFLLLGGDRAPGRQQGPLGLFDVPIVVFSILGQAGQQVVDQAALAVGQLNQSIAAAVQPLGLGAFPVIAALVALEVALVGGLAYLLITAALEVISAIDVPIINLNAIADAVRGGVGALVNALAGLVGFGGDS